MADKTDSKRLVDLKAALKKEKPKDLILLEDCAAIWGVTKPRFVTKRKEMGTFPEMKERQGNAHLYPAREAFQAMIDYIDRHQKASQSKAKRLAALVGTDQMAEHIAGDFSIAELAKANQMAAEIEARQREQGLYAPIAEIQKVVGMCFSEISEFMSNLSNVVDPHGKLPASTRNLIDTSAHEQLLRLHKNLKGMLSTDVGSGGTRETDRKSRPARTRRKRSTGRSRKT